jgi:hypothetical protein
MEGYAEVDFEGIMCEKLKQDFIHVVCYDVRNRGLSWQAACPESKNQS